MEDAQLDSISFPKQREAPILLINRKKENTLDIIEKAHALRVVMVRYSSSYIRGCNTLGIVVRWLEPASLRRSKSILDRYPILAITRRVVGDPHEQISYSKGNQLVSLGHVCLYRI
jgi:hypothetical protein